MIIISWSIGLRYRIIVILYILIYIIIYTVIIMDGGAGGGNTGDWEYSDLLLFYKINL